MRNLSVFVFNNLFNFNMLGREGVERVLPEEPKANKINKMRGSQIGCHFYFGRVAVLVAVA